jgi:hypothetical protein
MGCKVDYFSPSKSRTPLFVNCADNDSDLWPWNYFWTKTITTIPPVTTNGTARTTAAFSVEGASTVGQTVVRGMFAYVATQPFVGAIDLSAWAEYTLQRDNFKMLAKLYTLDGTLVSSFIDSVEASASAEVTLPATVCPLVLWLGASVQPTGATQTNPLPPTTASVQFTTAV